MVCSCCVEKMILKLNQYKQPTYIKVIIWVKSFDTFSTGFFNRIQIYNILWRNIRVGIYIYINKRLAGMFENVYGHTQTLSVYLCHKT